MVSVKLSQLIGMDVFSDSAKYIGKVFDAIIDLQKGELVRLTLEPIKAASKDEAKRIFAERTVLYSSVKAVEKIVIVSTSGFAQDEPLEQVPAKPLPGKPLPFSYKYKRV